MDTDRKFDVRRDAAQQHVEHSSRGLAGNAAEKPAGPIQTAVGELNSRVAHLHDNIGVLEARLERIMGINPPSPAQTSGQNIPPLGGSGVFTDLARECNAVESARCRITSMLDRLEL